MSRTAEIRRKTNETDIELKLSMDGGGHSISTGIGFFDHMLTALSVHGGLGLELRVRGDLEVDCHHTVEETAKIIGADSLGYLPVEELGCLAKSSGICTACFDGGYPTPVPTDTRKDRFEGKLSERGKN